MLDTLGSFPKKNLVGSAFGKLTVIGFAGRDAAKSAWWTCRCECGQEKRIRQTCLLRGDSESCGCLRAKMLSATRTTHGKSRSRTYGIWATMIQRCINPSLPSFKYYGARGVVVCDRWRESFESFLADMGEAPNNMSIERNDNELGYCPSNCRWASRKEQARNTSRNRLVKIGEETLCVSEWCERLHVDPRTVFARIYLGWNPVRAITQKQLHCVDERFIR